MILAESIKDTLLTDTQIKRKITAAAKQWLKERGYDNKIQFRCVRGTYHFDNCGNYMLSASYILNAATGFEFRNMGISMARLKSINQ